MTRRPRSPRATKPSESGMSPPGLEEPLLTADAVADLLACSAKAVYAWASQGELACVRLGRLVRFRPADVRRFVDSRTLGDHGR